MNDMTGMDLEGRSSGLYELLSQHLRGGNEDANRIYGLV
jgi:hypothetical protein